MNKDDIRKMINKLGEDILNDDDKAKKCAEDADEFIHDTSKVKSMLKSVLEQFTLMVQLFKDYVAGDYRAIPWISIVAIAGGIVYKVLPKDLIDDYIPALGNLDDMVVLKFVIGTCSVDLANYAMWKAEHVTKGNAKNTTKEATVDVEDVTEIFHDLDKYLNEKFRTEEEREREIERLSKLCCDSTITDKKHRAASVLHDLL